VRIDGTGLAALYGSHEGPTWKRRPAVVGERVVFLAADDGDVLGAPSAVALRRPLRSLAPVAPGVAGAWRSARAAPGGGLLVSHAPDPAANDTFGLYVLAGEGGAATHPLRDDPAVHELDAMSARPRPAPRGLVSTVTADARTGTILCLDARLTDRATTGGPPAAALQVLAATPRPAAGAAAAPYAPDTTLVASTPLAGDGSVAMEVPADVPLVFRTVDADGATRQDSRGWAWIRPGETRACIGCHEDREIAPPNRVPEAVAQHAAALGLQGGSP
jgi:hypothetical protein